MYWPGDLERGWLYQEVRICCGNFYRLFIGQCYGLFTLRSVSYSLCCVLFIRRLVETLILFSYRKFAPKFSQSFTGILVCFAVCFFLAQVVRFMLDRENKNRTKLYGPPTFDKALEDLSDKENTSFRYAL